MIFNQFHWVLKEIKFKFVLLKTDPVKTYMLSDFRKGHYCINQNPGL